MNLITNTVFAPEVGKQIELPTDIGRIDISRYGGGASGDGWLRIAVVGKNNDTEEYVVLKTGESSTEIASESVVFGTDIAEETVWFAVPASAYGGSDE